MTFEKLRICAKTVDVLMYVMPYKQMLLILNRNWIYDFSQVGKIWFSSVYCSQRPSLSDPDLKLKSQCIWRWISVR